MFKIPIQNILFIHYHKHCSLESEHCLSVYHRPNVSGNSINIPSYHQMPK